MKRINLISNVSNAFLAEKSTIVNCCNLVMFALLSSLLFSSCKKESYAKVPETEPAEELAAISQQDLVKRGEYLVKSIGCGDCHSPKRMGEKGPEFDPELHLSGYRQGTELPPISEEALASGWMLFNSELTAGAGPWGVSFAANLTSDKTGIGEWSLDQFKISLKKRKVQRIGECERLITAYAMAKFRQPYR